jgi:hypothetical protein
LRRKATLSDELAGRRIVPFESAAGSRKGEHFMLHPGDILLAEDTAGTGHSWKLVDPSPRRSSYADRD